MNGLLSGGAVLTIRADEGWIVLGGTEPEPHSERLISDARGLGGPHVITCDVQRSGEFERFFAELERAYFESIATRPAPKARRRVAQWKRSPLERYAR